MDPLFIRPYRVSINYSPSIKSNVLMCKQKPSVLHIPDSPEPTADSTADNNMDVHILMDVFTLSAVAVLVIILIVVQVIKKKKKLLATRSTGTQTSNIVPDLDATILKINSELTNLHGRLETMEQERLEDINAHRMSSAMPNPTQEHPAQWPGANPTYPSY